MYEYTRLKKRVRSLAVGLAATGMVVGNVASVAALSDSSLSMSDPRPSQTSVTYTFSSASFDAASLDCIVLEFDTAADGSGSVPAGLTTTGANLEASGSLITEASWTEDFTANGVLELTGGAEAPAASGTLVFSGITNGSTADTTYYGLFRTYTNADCSTGLTDEVVVAFVFSEGELVELTIDPTLTFTVSTVGSGQAVNGATTTHASGASGINFLNDVTSATNGVAAHDLNVTTNASGGYTVYIRHTGNLTNSNGDTITAHSGTNLSPTAFPAAGTEAWGYTSADSVLSAVGDGADLFTNGNDWAGFTTTNAEVMFNAAATPSTQTVRVGHQAGVASTTEAGTYQTTVVYTAVATF